ncbi:MAG TPA: hypothetical protein PL188_11210 [Candidatus Cloacimonadota bacterium]|nr:hypothetical protein [Candidatus Cloacimonadota bacterium]
MKMRYYLAKIHQDPADLEIDEAVELLRYYSEDLAQQSCPLAGLI